MVFRTLVRSFVNGLFISSYKMQILSLFIVDIPFVVVAVMMRKCFRNRAVFVVCMFYSLNFIIFDGYFVFEESFGYRTQNRELFILILICLFVFFSLFLFMILATGDIYEIIAEIKKKCRANQVRPSDEKQLLKK